MKHYSINQTKYLSDKEIKHLEKYCINDLPDIRAALMLVGYYTGARATEILSLTPESLCDNSIYIVGLKGSNDREIPIPPFLFRFLKTLEGPKLFPIHYNTLRRWWNLYRPHPTKTFHSLRHTCAIQLCQKGVDIRVVKYVLGHRGINNTMLYADYVYSQNELKGVLVG
jgi:integrase/recombinase XerC